MGFCRGWCIGTPSLHRSSWFGALRCPLIVDELRADARGKNYLLLIGKPESGGLIIPEGNLDQAHRHFVVEDLIEHAVTSRSDVVVARPPSRRRRPSTA